MGMSLQTQVFELLVLSWWWCLGNFKRFSFAGESTSSGPGYEIKKQTSPPLFSLCFRFVVQIARHQHSVPCHQPNGLLAARLPCHAGLLLLGTISPNKLVLLLVALVMVSYHRDRRVTNAGGKQATGHITGERV